MAAYAHLQHLHEQWRSEDGRGDADLGLSSAAKQQLQLTKGGEEKATTTTTSNSPLIPAQ